MNLQKKAILMVGGILFFIIVINTSVLTYIAYSKYRQAVLSKSSAFAEGLRKDLDKVLTLGVPLEALEGVNEKLEELTVKDPAMGYAMIMDVQARILFHSDGSQAGSIAKDAASLRSASSDKPLVQKLASYYDLSFPLLNAEEKLIGTLRAGVKLNAIHAQLYELLILALGISALCFFLSVALVHLSISRFITRPIKSMERAANRIAAGDITYVVDVRSQDEIGTLGNAINRMAHNLKDMLSKISGMTNSVSNVTSEIAVLSQSVLTVSDVQKDAVETTAASMGEMDSSNAKVAESAQSLSDSATETSSSIMQMAASIEKVSENAIFFSETAHDTASSVEEMLSAIRQIAESLDNLGASSEEIASSIDEVNATTRDIEHRAKESVGLAEAVMLSATDKGLSAAHAAVEGMDNIRKSVNSLSEVIHMLGKRTEDIGKILNVIDDVADQTNLLALNAAILASKAGEHGKGFTIVADEIKSLAERTSVSTNEIATLISAVQEGTKSSITLASDGIRTVEKGLVLVKDVSEALKDIAESSKASTEMARAIQRATAEEAQVIKQITKAIGVMTDHTETIARAIQEQSRGSRLITESTEKVKDLAQQVTTATGEQRDGSRIIAMVIENVTRQASQIAGATGKQKEKSIEIVQSMKKIRETTEKLASSSHEMNTVINSLKEDAVHLLSELQKFKV